MARTMAVARTTAAPAVLIMRVGCLGGGKRGREAGGGNDGRHSTHTHTHTHAHAHTHARTRTCTHTHASTHTHTLTSAHAHTHADMHMHAHTHTHTHSHHTILCTLCVSAIVCMKGSSTGACVCVCACACRHARLHVNTGGIWGGEVPAGEVPGAASFFFQPVCDVWVCMWRNEGRFVP